METLELTWSQQKLREGIAAGIAEGKAVGIAEGDLRARRDVLLDLIRTRFGEPPANLVAQIATADIPTLTSLLRKAALAGGLDELRDP